MSNSPLLLDTHVWVWWSNGIDFAPAARLAVDEALSGGRALLAAISFWEVATLVAKGRLSLAKSPLPWCLEAAGVRGLRVAPLTAEIAVESASLPGGLHKDPADRLIVATARIHGATLVTRDRAIISYASAGHLATISA